ncbi:hypothetical protein NAEGRDRAFT_59766 [Naegleria gruberi]|uniref:Asl1-like glycosyl hydrolase catalytic domain-containing protein n=1 Tax=Naegleria gruberi TaxID=5762 RepID=D2W0I9_NAEGR|nr:uncharacterized protein NAEGRDRAFT_59766 [Naegleria gruberi]EFC37437.1 hypothetical protein NAEGRDRAFT_59766 [Naegleria gruberi]|eukprot:XP_002670181.1 hypothetical protein NAEGRDRAFT_59766 [Naegleria gruberi strain NEG-M]
MTKLPLSVLCTLCFTLFLFLHSINCLVISPKKGMAFPNSGAPQTNSYKDLAQSLNVAWCYNWGNSAPSTGLPSVTSYVPQIWGSGSINNATMTKLANLNQQGMDNVLLGFNEPDLSEQSNLTPQQAVNLWPKLMETKRKLGSPAMAGYAPSTDSWLSQFMTLATTSKLQVDFIAVHWYGTPQYGSSFLQMVDETYKKYKLPIWVTEFAAADWSATASKPAPYTQKDAINFMNVTVRGLLERSYVERFSWFAPINPKDPIMGFSAVFNEDGSLTEVGKLYASLGVSNDNNNNGNPAISKKVSTSTRTSMGSGVNVISLNVLMIILALFVLIVNY